MKITQVLAVLTLLIVLTHSAEHHDSIPALAVDISSFDGQVWGDIINLKVG